MREHLLQSMEEQAHAMRQRASLLLESSAILSAMRDEPGQDGTPGAQGASMEEATLSMIGRRIMTYSEKQLVVDRSSLFLYEERKLELYTVYATGALARSERKRPRAWLPRAAYR